MQISLSSGNYNIIHSGQVFLFGEEEPLKIDVVCDDGFHFSLLLKFLKDNSGKLDIIQEVEGIPEKKQVRSIKYTIYSEM